MIVSTLDLETGYRDLFKREFPRLQIRHSLLSELSDEELLQVKVVMTYGYDLDAEIIGKMKGLHWLHIAQSGMDSLPFKLLQDKRVFITNSRGINSAIISEYVLCAMLNITRKTFLFVERARQRIWDASITVEELGAKTVGIFGLGKIGRQVSKKCNVFGMHILGVDIHSDEVPFVDQLFLPHDRQEVLAKSDFVVLCLPLLPSTAGMIGRKELSVMPDTSWIINVGRGSLINTDALIEAIDAKQIGGAVLDVFSTEPLPPDDKLWSRENIWITPHTAGDHFPQYIPRMVEIIRYNLARYPHFEQMQNPVRYELYCQDKKD
jgi:phosphoglycerate dehydrogenase-like enzyme